MLTRGASAVAWSYMEAAMKRPYWAQVNRKGAVELPLEVREALGLTGKDWLAFELDEGGVRVRRGSVAEMTAGILSAYAVHPPLTPGEEKEAIAQAIAEDVVSRMGE
jgi:bifunctional DNA-binding transcriptional regulator/antitoxin component of YhaV-PrlF toxin-antitoxin module